ncbi:MAG: glutamate--tRNA ligase family protein [archaeon]|jgi:glutamyl-tRNA synthetase
MEELKVPGQSNDEIKKTAFRYAIKNAFEHDGVAQVGSVVGKVKALFPDVILGSAMPIINDAVKEANSLGKEKLKETYDLFNEAGFELKQVEKEKVLPELTWFKKGDKIITRAAPCPTGPMHFGHARPYILSDEYVKKYGGKYIMRFDDTDPKVKIPEAGMEESFLADFKWLGININGGIVRQSDNLKRYHQIIEQLLIENKAYVCFCESETWRQKIWKGETCECRDKTVKEQLKYFKEMLNGTLKEGSCIIRLKTDLTDKDTSTRDFWIAKIVDDPSKHPNKKTHKVHVWPAYNLASVVDDYDMGINFTVRGQEHIPNEKKQRMISDHFGWVYPHTMYHGKISKLADMVLSKSKMKILMEKEGILRYDDPRMSTMKSFKRRGFKPETIRKIIFDLGLNINEAKISTENFASANQSFLGEVNTFPFIENKIELQVLNCQNGKFKVNNTEIIIDSPIQKFIVDKDEINKFKLEDTIRLKEGFNIKLTSLNNESASAEFISYEKSGYKTINHIQLGKELDATVLMSDNTEKKGISINSILKEKGEVVLLNNLGYVKIETKEPLYLVFGHV